MDLHILCTARIKDEILVELQHEDWIGIDYGAVKLIEHGIIPIAAFGDFDSISAQQRESLVQHIDVDVLPSEKDETDLEIGLNYALELEYNRVLIHGATGGRLDHFLGNLQLLVNEDILRSSSEFIIVDDNNVIQVLTAGTHIIQQIDGMHYVSFIPVNDHVIMSIEDLKYPLDRTPLLLGATRTISNEFISERAQVTVENGMVYMIQSRDQQA